jgi:type VI secretion system secreted protein VgrG
MPEYVQTRRLIAIDTALGKDVLLLQSFQGKEGISQLYHFQCECLSERTTFVEADKIIGEKVTITVYQVDSKPRFFNGIVSRFSLSRSDNRFNYYTLEMVPQLWLLTRTADCRIFQNKTCAEIIKEVLNKYTIEVEDQLAGAGSMKTEFCVQYRETDFNFISRLMEQFGISYYFKHNNSQHTMVLCGSNAAFKPCPDQPKARYQGTLGGNEFDEDFVTGMVVMKEVRPGQYTVNDFNFETPMTTLLANVAGIDKRKFEIYDYPGEYKTKGEGDQIAKLRILEEEASIEVIRGSSNCRPFFSGSKFTLQEHFHSKQNREYILTEIQHSASVGRTYQTASTGDVEHYLNYFTCIPSAVPFIPPRLTPRPIIQGPQTAIVVGPAGEEIYSDKYGRVKVQFHWDREGKYDEKSSCWIRVSQTWAGKKWGAVFLPRIGHEVIVEFLEGDPDHPLITGSVYNAVNMVPYTLPGEQTKSTIKSYSSKGGGGFNEFRFEDKKGSEQIFIHGEKDLDVRVKNDVKEWTGRDTHLIVKRDQKEKIERNKHQTITGDLNVKVGGTISTEAGQDYQLKVKGGKYAVDAQTEVHLKGLTNLVAESSTSLTIKVGGNFININSGGIFIKGTMVMINSGGMAGSGAGCSPSAPEAPLEADTANPGEAKELPPPKPPETPHNYSPQALSLQRAALTGQPLCPICEAAAGN